MSKLSPRVVLLVYLNFLLWQLGSELKFQAMADPQLPDDEVSTLKTVIDKLGLKSAPNISKTYCYDNVSGNGIAIECDCSQGSQTCHIGKLSMSSIGLTGVIPDAVGGLRHLSSLDLSNNSLHGPIPATLGKLNMLEYLDLSRNQLTGSIPASLGRLQNLRTLDLDYNLLDSTIPGNLGSLWNLEHMNLHFNRLSGSIPVELGNLVNLTTLALSENQLSGRLPDTLGNLTLLRYFYVSANSLSGTVPETYGQLTNLIEFSIGGNYISGPLPVDIIKSWVNITILSLLGNNFEGNLTKEVFNLPNLQHLSISDLGNATFELPSVITNTKFVTLILRNCSINGSIPKYIGDQMSTLKFLDLSFNNLAGGLPEFMKSQDLLYMSFSTNMLNGTISAWILQAVQTRIDLSFNNFLALDISEVPSNNPDLNLFACCRNFSATEPEIMYMRDPLDMMNTYCPGEEQKYQSLFINCGGGETIVDGITYDQDDATSRFYTSPKKNWAYSSSGDFLADNANSYDYTKKNVTIHTHSLYDRARLSPVSLKYYSFCLREGSYTVTLMFAEIVYTQDTDYTGLRKRAFDVYIQDDKVLHNFNIREQARGPNIPITKTFTAMVNKNNSLLMIHMYWDAKGSIGYPPSFNGPLISAISVTRDIDECNVLEQCRPSWMKPLFSGLGSGLGVLLLLIGAWWAHKAVKKRKINKRRHLFFKQNGGLLLEQQLLSGEVNVEKIKLFNSIELEKSTDNFNIDRVLGQGGQGTVFKGMLADGNIVAVKKSKIDDKGKVSEFINEVIILSQINHRNIVRLLGCCLETEVPLLVYEFIPNGTLSQYIYEQNEEFPLTWQMRIKIATEIAGALSYLHVAASCPIYHRDIKSTNILLDEKYRAKIADFGTSRSVAIDQTHLTTNVHGTFGYMDPEYYQSSQFTEKSDVYSFGVVLVELLTGKKPISAVTRSPEEEQEYRSLATYFIDSMQEDRLLNILDRRVVNEGSKEDIMIVANLARRCLNLKGRNRPTMREVTAELEAIQMSNRTHHLGAEFIPELYPIQQCDDVVSSLRGSTWDSGPASSLPEFPQSSMLTRKLSRHPFSI